jgi:5'-nucleotidase
MPNALDSTLVVAVSSRALFDLENVSRIFEESGLRAFADHHRQNERVPLPPGPAFPLVSRLLRLNSAVTSGPPIVEVILLSGQHPDTSLRVLNSIAHYGLGIDRFAFTGGATVVPYLRGFRVDLLLSRSSSDVQAAVDLGVAAARMYSLPEGYAPADGQIRIALDGDAVIFSEESEALCKAKGLDAFKAHEAANAYVPLPEGPFGKLLLALQRVQAQVPDALRLSLVTARNAPAHERVLRTLRAWGVSLDEAFFLGGLPKADILSALKPLLFVDDQERHLDLASRFVPCARVPYPSGSKLTPPLPIAPAAA